MGYLQKLCLFFLTIIRISSRNAVILSLILLISPEIFAWGGRGHHTICEAASFLVKEKELKKFLQNRPQIMGHLCNIPDIQWKDMGGEIRSAGDPTHFIDPEVIGVTPKDMPLDLEKIKKDFTGKNNSFEKEKTIYSIPRQMGSAYWRVEQMMNILNGLKNDFSNAKKPQNRSEEQNYDLPFNKAAYKFMTTAGIMGHYIGDLAQPFHNTADYDGWDSGHGGIHRYYEEEIVAELDGELLSNVLRKAKTIKQPNWLKGTYPERMRSFSQTSFNEIAKIKKLDPVTKKSEVKTEKGMQLKTAAVRKPAHEVSLKFKPLITTQMARAAWLLAQLWDEAYRNAGSPEFSAYQAYKYPFNVDFIYPDYDDTPPTK